MVTVDKCGCQKRDVKTTARSVGRNGEKEMGENMDYELADLIDVRELKGLTDSFSKLLGVATGVFDRSGKRLLASGSFSVCTDFHRAHPQTSERCRQSDLAMLEQTTRGKKYYIHQCQNGLMDTAAPIVIEGEYLGAFAVGMFLLEPPDMDFFSRQADEFGFDKEKYLKAVSEVPVISMDLVKQFMEFYHRMTSIIAKTGLAKLHLMELNIELERHRDHLEDLVQEKTADLATAKEAAEAANLAKSVFLANMSHELRTPLNAILGTGQIMSRDTDFPEKYKENLGILARSGKYLLSLVNDVLEISRIEAGRATLTKSVFSLKNALITIEEMTHLGTKKKGLELEVDYDPNIPENIRTDKAKLHQILNNLLDNATKYTKKGGIIFRVHVVNSSGNREIRDNNHQPASRTADKSSIINLRFIVEDTGIGISQDAQQSIFDHFVQASTTEESIKGVGLGLTICRQYASLMGGRISVKSQPGMGSTFTVELPVESVDESLNLPETYKRRVVGLEPGQPMFNILIVEDDDYSRIVLKQLLEQVGFSVLEAKDGGQAVEMNKRMQPDLIWLDIRLPVMDGLEATRRIREREHKAQSSKHNKKDSARISASSFQPSTRAKRVPIIALTASVFEEDKEKVLEAGCDDFVRKPFYEEEIFDKMAQYLEVRYIYGEQEKQDKARIVTRAITPSDLAGLTTDWIDRCLEAAKKGKSAEIFDLMKEVKDDHGRVADAMAEMARNYKYSEIVALIEKGSNYEK